MDAIADLYVEYAPLLFLVALLVATGVLLATARHSLGRWWWVGALVGGGIVAALALMLALALQSLSGGQPQPLEPRALAVIGFAGLLGCLAALDVQLAYGAASGRTAGPWVVAASALVGPAIVVGAYIFLIRSTEAIRLAG